MYCFATQEKLGDPTKFTRIQQRQFNELKEFQRFYLLNLCDIDKPCETSQGKTDFTGTSSVNQKRPTSKNFGGDFQQIC